MVIGRDDPGRPFRRVRGPRPPGERPREHWGLCRVVCHRGGRVRPRNRIHVHARPCPDRCRDILRGLHGMTSSALGRTGGRNPLIRRPADVYQVVSQERHESSPRPGSKRINTASGLAGLTQTYWLRQRRWLGGRRFSPDLMINPKSICRRHDGGSRSPALVVTS